MKKLLFIFSAALISLNMNAQKITADNVPSSVTTAFKAKFSIAEKTTWELEYDNYQADFSVGKVDFSALFDKDGKWLETVTYIKPSDLPKAVKETLGKKYGEVLSAYKLDDVEKVETEKTTKYTMDVIKGEETFELEIDSEGRISKDAVKSETKKD